MNVAVKDEESIEEMVQPLEREFDKEFEVFEKTTFPCLATTASAKAP